MPCGALARLGLAFFCAALVLGVAGQVHARDYDPNRPWRFSLANEFVSYGDASANGDRRGLEIDADRGDSIALGTGFGYETESGLYYGLEFGLLANAISPSYYRFGAGVAPATNSPADSAAIERWKRLYGVSDPEIAPGRGNLIGGSLRTDGHIVTYSLLATAAWTIDTPLPIDIRLKAGAGRYITDFSRLRYIPADAGGDPIAVVDTSGFSTEIEEQQAIIAGITTATPVAADRSAEQNANFAAANTAVVALTNEFRGALARYSGEWRAPSSGSAWGGYLEAAMVLDWQPGVSVYIAGRWVQVGKNDFTDGYDGLGLRFGVDFAY